MKLHRIYAIILRFLYLFRHSFDKMIEVFYWPTVDLLLWGLTSLYIRKVSPSTSHIVVFILSGILLWIIISRAQYEISVSLLEDLWNKNLVNIFVSPLTFAEWITAFLILGLIKASISLVFASLLAFLLYHYQIFILGLYLIPFFLMLIMTGWWVGFFITGIILRYGSRVQALAWTAVLILSPFSAVYYPLSILPGWAQRIASILPTSYIFEGARDVIQNGTVDSQKLIISFLLNLVYLFLALVFLKKSFEKVLKKGLIKVF